MVQLAKAVREGKRVSVQLAKAVGEGETVVVRLAKVGGGGLGGWVGLVVAG